MKGFTLNDWVLFYLNSPYIEVFVSEKEEKIYDYYTRVHGLLMRKIDRKSDDFDPEGYPLWKQHVQELFGHGHDFIKFSSSAYMELNVIKEYNIPYVYWKQMSLRERAKVIVHFQKSNMTETMRRHVEILEKNKESEGR